MTYVNWQIKTTCVYKHGPRKLEVRFINATEVSSGHREAVLPAAAKKHNIFNKYGFIGWWIKVPKLQQIFLNCLRRNTFHTFLVRD